MPKCIGIIGTRRRDNRVAFKKCYAKFKEIYEKGDTIVSGGCPKGGDRFAEIIALTRLVEFRIDDAWSMSRVERHEQIRIYDAPITIHLADWARHGRGAGFVRNGDIANDADVLIAVVAKDRTGGTEDTVKKALKIGYDVHLV